MEDRFHELDEMNLEDKDIATIALLSIGLTAEAYCENDYADPMLYKLVSLATKLSHILGHEELALRLETTKMFCGETVNKMIEEHDIPVGKDWN